MSQPNDFARGRAPSPPNDRCPCGRYTKKYAEHQHHVCTAAGAIQRRFARAPVVLTPTQRWNRILAVVKPEAVDQLLRGMEISFGITDAMGMPEETVATQLEVIEGSRE